MYQLNHLATKDRTEKEWTAVANPAAGPNAQPAKATTLPGQQRLKKRFEPCACTSRF